MQQPLGLVVAKASTAGLEAPVAGGKGQAGALPGCSPFISHLKPAAGSECAPAKGTGFVLCLGHHTPDSFLGLFSYWTKRVAQIINSQLPLEQHCLSFAPLYLQGTLLLQGFLLYLFSLGLLVCPVNDDGCLECQALQESTGVAKAMTNTSPKLQGQLSGQPFARAQLTWTLVQRFFPFAACRSHPCYTLPTALPGLLRPVGCGVPLHQGAPGIMCEWGFSSPISII